MAQAQRNNSRDEEKAQALVVVQPPRLPMPREASEFGTTPGQWKALVDAIFPSAKSVNGVMLALEYCKSRNLDPFKRAVHIVPMWNSALNREVETVWPGINELRTTAARTGRHAGNDDCVFGPTVKRKFEASEQRGRGNDSYKLEAKCPEIEFPEWAQITVYKIVGNHRVPFVGPKVRFIEAFSGEKGLRVPNSKWRASPFQMLEKCAEAAALRRAFPEELANDYTAEEMEGQVLHADVSHSPVMDAGEITATNDKQPTRESVAEKMGNQDDEEWSDEVKAELVAIQRKIDLTHDPRDLEDAKKGELKRLAEKWPAGALAELETRFGTRIRICNGEIIDDDQSTTEEGKNDEKPD